MKQLIPPFLLLLLLICQAFADHIDDQGLWAYFHRRTGMLRPDFVRLRAIGQWHRVKVK